MIVVLLVSDVLAYPEVVTVLLQPRPLGGIRPRLRVVNVLVDVCLFDVLSLAAFECNNTQSITLSSPSHFPPNSSPPLRAVGCLVCRSFKRKHVQGASRDLPVRLVQVLDLSVDRDHIQAQFLREYKLVVVGGGGQSESKGGNPSGLTYRARGQVSASLL